MAINKETPEEETTEHQFAIRSGQPATLIDGIVVQSVGEMVILQFFQSEPQIVLDGDTESSSTANSRVNSFCQGKFALTKGNLLLVSNALTAHANKIMAESNEEMEGK